MVKHVEHNGKITWDTMIKSSGTQLENHVEPPGKTRGTPWLNQVEHHG